MKLELIASAGDEPVALLAQETSKRHAAIVAGLADRLFGQDGRVTLDAELSYRWGCSVHCTAEFSTWWRARDDAPPAVQRNFLEVHADV
jgi:hypothetical protein